MHKVLESLAALDGRGKRSRYEGGCMDSVQKAAFDQLLHSHAALDAKIDGAAQCLGGVDEIKASVQRLETLTLKSAEDIKDLMDTILPPGILTPARLNQAVDAVGLLQQDGQQTT
ncbi:hypothetical protein SPRG_06918 [Saprolegnia parasitica CBS 223.65]|uniref:Uncharacterized protein n=1 Tax=Saprolegnia parasitica (strain CBS 223.65) TaxID=695850 RepID=A0A067CLH6_SAPPC|nr:hypothetical protein SPRG_06918 [Saprolegnia parasitica CBS 223.65]KDO27647.1 hypothetical protein SPRG_06918 [Saprolegnia parasitica CBS 223.65]|eukprot:XP_012201769.1 hypothetical protein SPRG_06918 [Saprolegnia parasitica CBS 223.65]